jgi:hypothetical protein
MDQPLPVLIVQSVLYNLDVYRSYKIFLKLLFPFCIFQVPVPVFKNLLVENVLFYNVLTLYFLTPDDA